MAQRADAMPRKPVAAFERPAAVAARPRAAAHDASPIALARKNVVGWPLRIRMRVARRPFQRAS